MNDVSVKNADDWDIIIEPRSRIWQLDLKGVWQYKYLLWMFVKRDIVSTYKQTILGPLWFFIQPILTTIIYMVIFGSIAKIKIDNLPAIPFYLAGITIWNYFADTLIATSNTFTGNASIFGKVYFPRLILPLSKVVSGLIKFAIQFLLFAAVFLYYVAKGHSLHPDLAGILIITPIVLIIMGGLGLGLGLFLSALTTKYRDLAFLISFGIQLGMYATPVIYPVSIITSKYKWMIIANPMSSLVEAFRKVYLGAGDLSWSWLAYSFSWMIFLVAVGTIIFNKVERTFMDTV